MLHDVTSHRGRLFAFGRLAQLNRVALNWQTKHVRRVIPRNSNTFSSTSNLAPIYIDMPGVVFRSTVRRPLNRDDSLLPQRQRRDNSYIYYIWCTSFARSHFHVRSTNQSISCVGMVARFCNQILAVNTPHSVHGNRDEEPARAQA